MSCKQMLDGLPYTSCGTRSFKMTCFSQNSEDFGWPLRSAWSICPSEAHWNWTDWLSLRFLRLIAPLRLSDPISQYRGTEGGHFLVQTHSPSSTWKNAGQRWDRSVMSYQSTSVLNNGMLFNKHQSKKTSDMLISIVNLAI